MQPHLQEVHPLLAIQVLLGTQEAGRTGLRAIPVAQNRKHWVMMVRRFSCQIHWDTKIWVSPSCGLCNP